MGFRMILRQNNRKVEQLCLNQQHIAENAVVLTLSLLSMDENAYFMRKSVSMTVFSKTQTEKSNKTALVPKRFKVVSLIRVLILSFKNLL